jgi:hypothetical protein
MKLDDVFGILEPPVSYAAKKHAPGFIGKSVSSTTVSEAQGRIKGLMRIQATATSDAEIEAIVGRITYWRTLIDVLHAADLVGPDNLPDVPVPIQGNADIHKECERLSDFGQSVLRQAKAQKRAS